MGKGKGMTFVKITRLGFVFLLCLGFVFSSKSMGQVPLPAMDQMALPPAGGQVSAGLIPRNTLPPNPIPPAQPFRLIDYGVNGLVDYAKYGHLVGVGTAGYKYVITDPAGLAAAEGEGIYPNTSA